MPHTLNAATRDLAILLMNAEEKRKSIYTMRICTNSLLINSVLLYYVHCCDISSLEYFGIGETDRIYAGIWCQICISCRCQAHAGCKDHISTDGRCRLNGGGSRAHVHTHA